MKLETAKTMLLILLIGTSLLLTFGMWSYKPSNEIVSNETVEEAVLKGTEKEMKELIYPSEIIFHNENAAYGFKSPQQQDSLYQDLISWVYYDLRPVRAEDRTLGERYMEIVFPDYIPMPLFENIIHQEGEHENTPTWSFRRVYVSFQSETASLEFQFHSKDGREIGVATVNDPAKYEQMLQMLQEINTEQSRLQEMMVLDEDAEEPIYLPRKSVTMSTHSIGVDNISPENMVNILFRDPSVVEVSDRTGGFDPIFFTDYQQMRVMENLRRLEFVVPNLNEGLPIAVETLLEYSRVHINNHAGWTNDYRLSSLEQSTTDQKQKNRVRYQMYYAGLPLMSGRSTIIEQTWIAPQEQQAPELGEYSRPLFQLTQSLNVELESVEMQSGERLKASLQSKRNISNIEAVRIGYQVEFQDEFTVILHPSWFIKENGSWTRHDSANGIDGIEGVD